jgi:hypothetical protein
MNTIEWFWNQNSDGNILNLIDKHDDFHLFDRAMGNIMPCEWRIWNDVVALHDISWRKWCHIHCFSPGWRSTPPFAGSSLVLIWNVHHWYECSQTGEAKQTNLPPKCGQPIDAGVASLPKISTVLLHPCSAILQTNLTIIIQNHSRQYRMRRNLKKTYQSEPHHQTWEVMTRGHTGCNALMQKAVRRSRSKEPRRVYGSSRLRGRLALVLVSETKGCSQPSRSRSHCHPRWELLFSYILCLRPKLE